MSPRHKAEDRTRWPNRRTLRAARTHAGLSQQALANAASCTPATIYDLEHGRNEHPSWEKVANIVAALRQHKGLKKVKATDLFPVKGQVYE